MRPALDSSGNSDESWGVCTASFGEWRLLLLLLVDPQADSDFIFSLPELSEPGVPLQKWRRGEIASVDCSQLLKPSNDSVTQNLHHRSETTYWAANCVEWGQIAAKWRKSQQNPLNCSSRAHFTLNEPIGIKLPFPFW